MHHVENLQPCQKSPSMNTATLAPVKTMSGRPGSDMTCVRYLRPREKAQRRMSRSGEVFMPRIRDMFRLRWAGVRWSTIRQLVRKKGGRAHAHTQIRRRRAAYLRRSNSSRGAFFECGVDWSREGQSLALAVPTYALVRHLQRGAYCTQQVVVTCRLAEIDHEQKHCRGPQLHV